MVMTSILGFMVWLLVSGVAVRRTGRREIDTRPGAASSSAAGGAGVRIERAQPAFEKAPLGIVVSEFERAAVGSAGLVDAREPAQDLGAGRVQVAIVVELEPVEDGKRGLRVACLGGGRGAIELHHRRSGQPGQLPVEGRDLSPVGRLVGVQGGDGSL